MRRQISCQMMSAPSAPTVRCLAVACAIWEILGCTLWRNCRSNLGLGIYRFPPSSLVYNTTRHHIIWAALHELWVAIALETLGAVKLLHQEHPTVRCRQGPRRTSHPGLIIFHVRKVLTLGNPWAICYCQSVKQLRRLREPSLMPTSP